MQSINPSPSLLYKFCSPEHNIISKNVECNTLRVGTLHGFRKEENELLRDEGEGRFEYKISFPKLTEISGEWYRELDCGQNDKIHIGELKFSKERIEIKDATFSGDTHNCWVFCVSLTDTAAGDISVAHDDKWSFPAENVRMFGNYLSDTLFKHITHDDLPQVLLRKYTFSELKHGLKLYWNAKPVMYIEREATIEIEKESDYPVENLKQLKSEFAFIKPASFSEEQEFRFAFWLTIWDQIISINDNPKILNLRPIEQFISKA